MPCLKFEIISSVSLEEVTPSVIRYLENVYEHYKPEHGEKKLLVPLAFGFGEDHPVYHIMPDRLPRIRKPYAWYLRLADVPDFLQLITPILEKRLAESPLAGYTGEVKITFYRHGVRMVFNKGKIGDRRSLETYPIWSCRKRWLPTPYLPAAPVWVP